MPNSGRCTHRDWCGKLSVSAADDIAPHTHTQILCVSQKKNTLTNRQTKGNRQQQKQETKRQKQADRSQMSSHALLTKCSEAVGERDDDHLPVAGQQWAVQLGAEVGGVRGAHQQDYHRQRGRWSATVEARGGGEGRWSFCFTFSWRSWGWRWGGGWGQGRWGTRGTGRTAVAGRTTGITAVCGTSMTPVTVNATVWGVAASDGPTSSRWLIITTITIIIFNKHLGVIPFSRLIGGHSITAVVVFKIWNKIKKNEKNC